MLNNTNNDGTPYFLTANHCISTQSEADDCICIFNYESSSCNGSDGSTSQSIAAGTLRATRQESDFVLLEFSHKPFSTYNPYYAGWDNSNTIKNNVVGIHHPSGDVKKICRENENIQSTAYSSGTINNTANHWRIPNWDVGVTEGGSSGSALFDNNHRVIGQLHGGAAACNGSSDNNLPDWYGKFSTSWDEGITANERLQNWLDPTNSGVIVLDGSNVCSQGIVEQLNLNHDVTSGIVEIQAATETITSTSTIKSGATVTYEAGQSIILSPGFIAETGSNFTAKTKEFNCVPGCYPISIDLLPNVFTPNGDGINDQLCYPVNNATSYEFEAYNRWGSKVFSSSGSVIGNQVCVWDGAGACAGCWYAVIITFRNECDEKSEAYGVTTFGNTKSTLKATTNTDSKNELLLNITNENVSQKLDFAIYPNPNSGVFSIDIKTDALTTYSLEIINSTGLSIYRINQLKETKVNISKSSLKSGVYFIRVNNGESVVTKKMIVQY